MDGLKVTGQVALDQPATCRSVLITVLQLQFDRSYRMVHTPGGPEPIGRSMEVTLPDRLHGPQHRSLDHSIPQTGDPEGPHRAVRFWDVDAPCGLRLVAAR